MLQMATPPLDYAPVKTVLVVEDDWMIRIAVAEDLSACGFEVLQASSAPRALAILEGGTSVDIVFSDIEMPGFIDGIGLARWVRSCKPHIKVILTSGHSSTKLPQELAEIGPILPKPYDLTALLRRIFLRQASSHQRATGPRPERCSGTVSALRQVGPRRD